MNNVSPTRRKAPATVAEVNALRTPGRHSIGGGLILVVNPGGSRAWMTRFRDATGRCRDMGIGAFPEVTLKEAREKAADLRRQVRDGLDPVAERRKQREAIPTFKEAAASVFDERKAAFENVQHQTQWMATLRSFTFPFLGDCPVNEITGPMIVRTLKPIWTTKPETARRVLQRIATVIAWAVAHGHREHEAPIKAIRMGLPPQPKGKKHFAAVPYSEAPEVLRKLRAMPESNARNCLAFVIWTACRSGEARGAKWDEVDLEAATWTIPADRIKMRCSMSSLSRRQLWRCSSGSTRRDQTSTCSLACRSGAGSIPTRVSRCPSCPCSRPLRLLCQRHRTWVAFDLPRLGQRRDELCH